MVNRRARDQLAELLRHFAAGNMTNVDYEEAVHAILARYGREDRALWAVHSAAWFLYDDTRVHHLRGKRALTEEGRRAVARCVTFLHSDLEYEWPIRGLISLSGCLLRVCTFGLAGLLLGPVQERRLRRLGSWDLWPFFRASDYQDALTRPRLLGGSGRAPR